MKKYALYFLSLILFASCEMTSITLTEDEIKTLNLSHFTTVDGIAHVTVDNKTLPIENIVTSGINADNIAYYFLSTEVEKKQVLVVLNNTLDKVQWCEYYTEYCYFDSEELVALVIEPFETRHQGSTITVNDFKIDFYNTIENSFKFPNGVIAGNKQLNYLKPSFLEASWGGYLVYWEQGYFSFHKNFYGLYEENLGRRGTEILSTVGENYSAIEELLPIEPLSEWQSPKGYTTIAQNENEDYIVEFIVAKERKINWETCEIQYTNKETEQTETMLFADVFEYQDALKSIIPAQNRDERIAFIVETKEFTYDFYFDPSGDTTDIFLRPSSFVRLYPR